MKQQTVLFIVVALIVGGFIGYSMKTTIPAVNQGAGVINAGNSVTALPGYEIKTKNIVIQPSGVVGSVADCSIGKKVVGGGYQLHTIGAGHDNYNYYPFHSYPRGDSGWQVAVRNADTQYSASVDIYAICVN